MDLVETQHVDVETVSFGTFSALPPQTEPGNVSDSYKSEVDMGEVRTEAQLDRIVRGAIFRLDEFLNQRIIRSVMDSERRHWWRVKVRAKRLLATIDSPVRQAELAVRMLLILQKPQPKPHVRRPERRRVDAIAS
jgi:hypothetical protein